MPRFFLLPRSTFSCFGGLCNPLAEAFFEGVFVIVSFVTTFLDGQGFPVVVDFFEVLTGFTTALHVEIGSSPNVGNTSSRTYDNLQLLVGKL